MNVCCKMGEMDSQGFQYFFWDETQVNDRLREVLIRAYYEVDRTAEKYNLKSLGRAALALAIKRVARAIELRGIFP